MPAIRNLTVLSVSLLLFGVPLRGAEWQYRVAVDSASNANGKPQTGSALLWVPPKSGTLRGLFLMGQLLFAANKEAFNLAEGSW